MLQKDNSFSVIIFQNVARLSNSAYWYKSLQMSQAFKESKVSIAMYIEYSLNDRFLNPNEKFVYIMRSKSPKEYSTIGWKWT